MRHELQTTERTAWMVERRPDADPAIKSPGPHWVRAYGHDEVGQGGCPNLRFTSDPHNALQFSRQQDAQRWLDWMGNCLIDGTLDEREYAGISNRVCLVTEHIFEEVADAR